MKLYGDPQKIILTYHSKVIKQPQVRQGHTARYKYFYNSLMKCKVLIYSSVFDFLTAINVQ